MTLLNSSFGFGAPLPNYGEGSVTANINGASASASAPSFPDTSSDLPAFPFDADPGATPAPYFMGIDSYFNDGANFVQDFAFGQAQQAQYFVSQLGTLAASLQAPTVNPAFPTLPTAPAIAAPIAPAILPISYQAPSPPTSLDQPISITTAFPEFTAGPPVLMFPNAPQQPTINLPDAPSVDLNFVYPTVDVELPLVPQLLSLNIQPFDGVTFPTLSATAPVLTAIPPSVTTYVPNAPYTDALLSELTTTLQQRLDIGNTGTNTGLPPIVEQNLWNRGREREYIAQRDAISALERMESMGFALPPGVYTDSYIKIQTDTAYTLAGNSRDVAAKQADLEQANIKMALESTISIEGKLIDYANQTEQRRFDAIKYATEAGISVYNAQVQAFGEVVAVYKAAIDIYTAQINGARAQVEIYTAEIQAEKLKVDMNTALIEQYKVQVDAALASIQVFQGEISLIKTQAEVEQLKVQIFGEEVRAYSAQAQLFSTQVEAYKAGIQAEGAKEQVFATQAQVYGELVGAVSKEIDAQLEVFKTRLQGKTLDVEVFKALVQSEAERVRAIAAQNQSVAAIYGSTVQGTSSYNNTLVEEYKAATTIAEQILQVAVSAADANGKLYIATAQISTDAAKVAAQVESQLAASALGTVTYATHRSRQDSLGASTSHSFGQSKSYSMSQSKSSGASTSVSYSSSTSVSASASGSSGFAQNTNIAEAQ